MRPGAGTTPATLLAGVLAATAVSCRGAPPPPDSRNPTVTFHEETGPNIHEDYRQAYAFSLDWFSVRIPTWRRLFGPLKGRPDLRYLEIGVYEGRSFIWMLENVLTHPTARLTAVDVFIPPEVHQRFLDNIELSGQGHRVTTIKGYSSVELRKLPLESFDIIYVDGSHTADDVLADAVLGWGLLKTGGIIVFDDFPWPGTYYTGPDSHLPAELLPGMAINAFMQAYRNYIDVIEYGYQVFLRKRDNPCPNKSACSPIGQYVYDWSGKRLFRVSDMQPEELSEKERLLLEEALWRRIVAKHKFVFPGPFGEDPNVRALLTRLKADIAPSAGGTDGNGNRMEPHDDGAP